LEQESERWVLFPILLLAFSVVLDKSQTLCCPELSIKSEQFGFGVCLRPIDLCCSVL